MYLAPGLLAVSLLSGPAVMVSPAVTERLEAGEKSVFVLIALREGTGGRTPLAALDGDQVRVRRRFAAADTTLSAEVTLAGLEALRRRPDVLAVSLDGVVHPAGQVGTAQIGADRLGLMGVTGFGRSVAIVDSGLDLSHPDLGGNNGVNTKVVAGWNFADGSAELADCSGHGTEVAGVVAGPQGVAPDAGLVVLKIFGGVSGCRDAKFSDVLAAVDWSVTHREQFHIEAINLSLADDRSFAAYCDADDPAAAAVFDAARKAGIAVVAAAGNAGKTDGLAWPACFSGVAAVGMVYSASSGPTSWGAVCRDKLTGPDLVPCASNSGSGLSLMAPGVAWSTTTSGGGRISTFSGTSAAAPAAAAAILLVRQGRALADPATAVDLLRSTGVPVGDDKSGRFAPRMDLAAASAAAAPVTGPCSATVIPDGSGQLECEAVVSSLVGNVSTLTAALSVDHPDPTQLVVTLRGPDGTSVVLMNRSGEPGHAVREIFGRTSAPIEALSAFSGKPVAGLWKLRILDTVAGRTGKLVSWSIQIEPEVPTASAPLDTRTALFPTSSHQAGRFGSFYTTDVRLFNSDGSKPADVTLRYTPAGQNGTEAGRSLTVTIPPLGTRILADILGNGFRTNDYGPIFLSAPPSVVAGARTESTALRGGAYGLFVNSVAPGRGVALGERPHVLIPTFRSDGFRVNAGFTEVSGQGTVVELALKDRFGAPRGAISRIVPPLSSLQVNDLYEAIGAAPDENDRFEVRVVSGKGRVVAYSTAVDNKTNDGFYVTGVVPVSDLLISAASKAAGQFGAVFRTDIKLANPSTNPIRVKVTYFPTVGPSFDPVIVPLQGSETRLLVDALGVLFGSPEDMSGALRLTALDGATLVASSRTYTSEGKKGSYGLAIDPVATGTQATPGRKIALTFLSGAGTTRTNLGFVETAGRATRGRITFYAPDGIRLSTRDLYLQPFSAVQWNDIFTQLDLPHRGGDSSMVTDASAILEVLEGGALTAHAIQLDNITNDASFIPGFLLP